jgi:hypothetical protein
MFADQLREPRVLTVDDLRSGVQRPRRNAMHLFYATPKPVLCFQDTKVVAAHFQKLLRCGKTGDSTADDERFVLVRWRPI